MAKQPAALVLLIGLPAAGKTTFAKTFSVSVANSDNCVVTVEYDRLISLEKQKKLVTADSSVDWKAERRSVLKLVADYFQGISVPQISSEAIDRSKRVIVLIDDNNYYSSMRYEYFQLARMLQIGFCQLFIDVPLDKAKLQNFERSSSIQVPCAVIEKMAAKLEPPNPDKNSWDKLSLTIENADCETMSLILDLVNEASENPVKPLEEPMEKQACPENLLHEVDKLLRKHISERMRSSSAMNLSKEHLQLKAKGLKLVKDKLRQDLKFGHIAIPENIATVNPISPLLDNFVHQLIQERINY